MTNKTLPTLGAGIAISAGDLFLTRQGADTNDTKVTGTQLITFVKANGAAGSTTQFQYNNAGALAGAAGLTYDSATGAVTLTSASATALTVGPNGATNPVLTIKGDVASSATGILITPTASGSGVTISATGGTNEPISLAPKGTGDLKLTATSSSSTFRLAQYSGTDRLAVSQNSAIFTPNATSVTSTKFLFTAPSESSSGITAGTEAIEAYFNFGITRQHASNTAITVQRDMRISPATHSFATAGGVITDAATFSVDGAPIGGTNATLTNASAIYVPTIALSNVTNGYGLNIVAPSGATTNYAALLTGITSVSSSSATAFVVGLNGITNPAFVVDASTASSQNGIKVASTAGSNAPILSPNSPNASSGVIVANKGTGNIYLQPQNVGSSVRISDTGLNDYFVANYNSFTFTPATLATASVVRFSYTGINTNAMTAGTEFTQVYFNLGQTYQHSTGAITTQRDMRITPMTHSAVAASTITDAYGLYIDRAPAAGTNVTITNAWAVGMAGKLLVNSTDATTAVASFQQVAGGAYMGMDWTATSTTGVRFSIVGYGKHSGNGDITSTGHLGGILGFAQKTGTGTDALVIGVEGRVGAVAGTVTLAAAHLATFDTDTEDAGTMTTAVGYYMGDQSDAAHITNKYSFFSDDAAWTLRNDGPATINGKITQDSTITPPGTTGAQTINKPTGKVNFAAGATSLVVTNNLCTANSIVLLNQQTLDATMSTCNAIPDAGFFTIVAVGTPTAEVKVAFMVIN